MNTETYSSEFKEALNTGLFLGEENFNASIITGKVRSI